MDTKGMTKNDLKDAFKKMDGLILDMKENQIGNKEIATHLQRSMMLKFLDKHWSTFLSSMEYVKQNIGGQAYAQRDPAMEYKKRGVELFNEMIDDIKYDIIKNFVNCQVRVEMPTAPVQKIND